MSDPMRGSAPFPQGDSGPVSYGAGGRSGLAVGALICGIVGILTAIVLVGVAVGIVGIVLGAVALAQMARNPQVRGRGMAVTGLVLGIVAVAMGPLLLLVAILLPSLSRARELANRSACAANARGIMQSMVVYASDNQDTYPVAPYAPLSAANAGTSTENTGATSAEGARAYIVAGKSKQDGAPLAAAWMLVLSGEVSPKNFLCKSDPFAAAPAAEETAGGYYANFQADDQVSYSFAYPYLVKPEGAAVGKWWRNTSDDSLPIVSDMAPLNGTGKPARDVTAVGTRAANSGNHLNDGQNVGFADGHTEFMRQPDVGQASDNVFTVGVDGPTSGGVQPGVGPVEIKSETFPYDIVVLPVRNLNTGKLW